MQRYDKNNDIIWEYNDLHLFVSENRRWAINQWYKTEGREMPRCLTHFCYHAAHFEKCWNYVDVPGIRDWDPCKPEDYWRCGVCHAPAPDDLITVWRLLKEK